MTKQEKTPEKTNKVNPLARLRTDVASLVDGVWMDFGHGLQVKVAAWENENMQKLREELQKPWKTVLQAGGEIPTEEAEKIFTRLISETIVTDWKGAVHPETGEDLPYKQAHVIIGAKEYRPQFVQPIIAFSQTHANYRAQAKETATKN